MERVLIRSPREINVSGANAASFPVAAISKTIFDKDQELREIWLDSVRDWKIYSKEIQTRFWDTRDIVKEPGRRAR